MGNITSEYELDVYCSNHTECDGNCKLCPAFGEWVNSDLYGYSYMVDLGYETEGELVGYEE